MLSKISIATLLLATGSFAQQPSAATPPAFDVITIRTSHSGVTTTATGTRFETTTIRTTDDGYTAQNIQLKPVIADAYNVKDDAIVNAPSWINSTSYDINAKITGSADAPPPKISGPERRLMLQSLLAERFNLAVHRESKDAPIYKLEIARSGSHLHPADLQAVPPLGPNGSPMVGFPMYLGPGHYRGVAVALPSLVDLLHRTVGRPVIDATNLTGKFDLDLHWSPDDLDTSGAAPGDTLYPGFFKALEDQLGLRLTPARGPVTTLVIDHIDPPTPN